MFDSSADQNIRPEFFQVYDPEIVEKGWGSEVLIRNNIGYCGKILRYHAGAVSSFHFHQLKTETFYVLKGSLLLRTHNPRTGEVVAQKVFTGRCIHLPKGTTHQVEALEETSIMEVSTSDFPDDTYRVAPGDSQR